MVIEFGVVGLGAEYKNLLVVWVLEKYSPVTGSGGLS